MPSVGNRPYIIPAARTAVVDDDRVMTRAWYRFLGRQQRYATFYDTTTQTAAVINTAYAMRFNNTDLSFAINRDATDTSKIIVPDDSVYNFQFSCQIDKTTAPVGFVYIWFRVDGVDVPASASQIRVQGNNAETIAAWNIVLSMKADSYFQIMWSVDDTAIQLLALPAVAPVPAIPSVILTVTEVSI